MGSRDFERRNGPIEITTYLWEIEFDIDGDHHSLYLFVFFEQIAISFIKPFRNPNSNSKK